MPRRRAPAQTANWLSSHAARRRAMFHVKRCRAGPRERDRAPRVCSPARTLTRWNGSDARGSALRRCRRDRGSRRTRPTRRRSASSRAVVVEADGTAHSARWHSSVRIGPGSRAPDRLPDAVAAARAERAPPPSATAQPRVAPDAHCVAARWRDGTSGCDASPCTTRARLATSPIDGPSPDHVSRETSRLGEAARVTPRDRPPCSELGHRAVHAPRDAPGGGSQRPTAPTIPDACRHAIFDCTRSRDR